MEPARIRPTFDNGAARIVLAVVASKLNDPEVFKLFQTDKNDSTVEVAMQINGVDVPVIDVLTDLWTRMLDCVDTEAKRIAVEMVTAKGLDPIYETLREADTKIRTILGIFDEDTY